MLRFTYTQLRRKFIFISLLSISLAMVTTPIHAHKLEKDIGQHIKPGASILLEHKPVERHKVGEKIAIQLQFKVAARHRGQIAYIHLNNNSSLKIHGKHAYEEVLNSEELIIPLIISAQESAKHYLGVQVKTSDLYGNKSARVFEIAVQVENEDGSVAKGKPGITKASAGVTLTDKGGRLLQIMNSTETTR